MKLDTLMMGSVHSAFVQPEDVESYFGKEGNATLVVEFTTEAGNITQMSGTLWFPHSLQFGLLYGIMSYWKFMDSKKETSGLALPISGSHEAILLRVLEDTKLAFNMRAVSSLSGTTVKSRKVQNFHLTTYSTTYLMEWNYNEA